MGYDNYLLFYKFEDTNYPQDTLEIISFGNEKEAEKFLLLNDSWKRIELIKFTKK